jgi:hypothetical protein
VAIAVTAFLSYIHGTNVALLNHMNSANMNSPYQTPGGNDRGESVIELMRGIVQDARTLSAKELAAAKLEITQEIKKSSARAFCSASASLF